METFVLVRLCFFLLLSIVIRYLFFHVDFTSYTYNIRQTPYYMYYICVYDISSTYYIKVHYIMYSFNVYFSY